MTANRDIGVAILGMGWMGGVHARAFSSLSRLDDLPLTPKLIFCADDNAERLQWAQRVFGFTKAGDDWRQALTLPEVNLICITAPTEFHAEMVEAAARAGKHIYCEKPVGRGLADTRRAATAVAAAGVLSSTGYNYRHLPVVRYCRQLLQEGRLGAIEQINAHFLSMYGANPLSPLSWRFQNARAGSGVVADILSHAIDIAQSFAGPVKRVTANAKTFITERPLPTAGAQSHYATAAADAPMGPVENEDYIGVLAEYENGAVGQLQASRVARGPKSQMGFALYGEKGSASWDFERMNELQIYLPAAGDPTRDGFTRLLGGAVHPGHSRINPGDGNGIGYEDTKLLEAAALLRDIAAGKQDTDGMTQALRVAEVNAAVLRACASGQWETVTRE